MYSPESAHRPRIEELPSPEQLSKVAAIGMVNAKKEGKQYRSRNNENTHFFMPKDSKTVEIFDEDEYTRTYHRIVGRVARVGFRHWSMQLAEPNWTTDGTSESGYRCTYFFEWTHRGAIRADKNIVSKHPDDVPEPSLDDSIVVPDLDHDIFEPDFLHAVSALKVVSAADCDELIRNMRAFSSSPKYELHYNR